MFRLISLTLVLMVICLVVVLYFFRPPINQNKLALGATTKTETLDISIQSPVDLDGMTKSKVLELRRAAVLQHSNLLTSEYTPSEAVFGQIVDGLPWWGIEGQFRNGPGQKSPEGTSEEARFILNPYLLVAADFYGITTPPYICVPRFLSWQPFASHAEVFYEAACVTKVNYSPFDLIAYNARDLNLNYIFVDYTQSRNVAHRNPPIAAYAIPHYIHQGGSCGYPGGCNNMSPRSPEIDALSVTDLPASVVTHLWHNRPSSPNDKPDMTFVIRFE